MRYEFKDVVIDLSEENQLVDITTVNDEKKVFTITPSTSERDRMAREIMGELRNGAG